MEMEMERSLPIRRPGDRRRRHGDPRPIRALPLGDRDSRAREGDIRTVVQAAIWVAVGDDLDGGVGALGDVQAIGQGEAGHAEGAQAGLLEGLAQHRVEGRADVVAEADQHLDVRLDMAHREPDLAARQWPQRAVRRGRVEGAAGERRELVLVEAPDRGIVEVEVGACEGEGGRKGD